MYPAYKQNSGFTLIEALVTMVLLASGLLGMIALQAKSLKNNQSAYLRTQATLLAYDMADRIRANPVESSARASVKPSTLANSEYASTATATLKTACNTSPGCTPAEMAQNDRAKWLENLALILPKGTGTITVDAATKIFTITVSWDDSKSGTASTSFAMSFQL